MKVISIDDEGLMTLDVTEDEHKMLSEAANAKNCTIEQLINEYLADYIEKIEEKEKK